MNSPLIKEAYELNTVPFRVTGEKNMDSLIRFDSDNVFLDTIKPAEDGSKDIVLRFYEGKKMTSRLDVKLNFDFESVTETDMLEREIAPVETNPKGFSFVIKPFEIKTFKIKMKKA